MRRSHVLLAGLAVASALGALILVLAGGGATVIAILAAVEANRTLALTIFAVWALLANCLILPAGSLSVMAAGALFGTVVPALVWFTAQLLTTPFLHRAGFGNRAEIDRMVRRYLGARASALLADATREGVWTTILLRLTPVLPSAPTALIAAWAGVDRRSFLLGTVLVGWLRPLYFASLGAAAGSLARIDGSVAAPSLQTALPLALPFACAALLLAVRLYVRRASR